MPSSMACRYSDSVSGMIPTRLSCASSSEYLPRIPTFAIAPRATAAAGRPRWWRRRARFSREVLAAA